MMNDQTSPTAGGQRPDPFDPFSAPRDVTGLPVPPGAGAAARPVRAAAFLAKARPDLTAAGVLIATGAVLGVLGALAWYRFAPTVWLSVPADQVGQLKTGSGFDTASLLVSPEAKGLASVDGYYFIVSAVAALLLGALAFYLGRRGFGVRPADVGDAGRPGAGVGAWAGVLIGGFLTSSIAALVGHWLSLPDPVTLLRRIADGHAFHAPVTLHTTGLYLAAPVLALVVFTALTAAFTSSPPAPQWAPYGDRAVPGYFTPDDPYGFQRPGSQPPNPSASAGPAVAPGPAPTTTPTATPMPAPTPMPTPMPTPTPTPTPTPSPAPTPAPGGEARPNG